MMSRFEIPVGVIEGFFGRLWSWEARASCADFLADIGFGFYIYAPKDDRFLRQRWREPWPADSLAAVAALGRYCRARGLRFGIGFTPFELHLEEPADSTAALHAKVRQLDEAAPDLLCILFDDMRGLTPDLATRQARIVADIVAASRAPGFVVCPTYYSFDPVVERVFGTMPPNYLADLGRLIDPAIDIFWTGERVCSRSYPDAHLSKVAELLRRKPFLWDNYPVNDSAAMAPFIHLGPFRDRPPELQALIAGQAVNPMNQAFLSRIPLLSLADSYAQDAAYDPDRSFAAACRTLCGAELGGMLVDDLPLFQNTGLDHLSEAQRRDLAERYGAFRGGPYADEVLGWLEGRYAFDPACLT